jgi:hypothetical protein
MAIFYSAEANMLLHIMNAYFKTRNPVFITILGNFIGNNHAILLEPSVDDNRPLLSYLLPSPNSSLTPTDVILQAGILSAFLQGGINPLVAMHRSRNRTAVSFTLEIIREACKRQLLSYREVEAILLHPDADGKTPIEAVIESGSNSGLRHYLETLEVMLPTVVYEPLTRTRLRNGLSIYQTLQMHPNLERLITYACFLKDTLGSEAMAERILTQALDNLRWTFEFHIRWRQACILITLVEQRQNPVFRQSLHAASFLFQATFPFGLFVRVQPKREIFAIHVETIAPAEDKNAEASHYFLPTGLLDDETQTLRYR